MCSEEQGFDLQTIVSLTGRDSQQKERTGEEINILLFNKYVPSTYHAPASAQGR